MRRKDREISDLGEIDTVLRKARVCRIALADGNGPYIVPLCFGYEPGAVYLHSAPEGKKLDMIRSDPRCCFEVDLFDSLEKGERPCAWSMNYRSVIGFGTATILSDPEDKRHGLLCIMRQYHTGIHEFSDDEVSRVAVIRIAVTSMTAKKRG
ncbi:MAG: pyridoxamine 5'-phosphate oxidase family protein [Methanomicrobiales archaeon]|nr:pyridoxamine 5'-phosphate oxidase family protein [Methanomicrobiales archaeon]